MKLPSIILFLFSLLTLNAQSLRQVAGYEQTDHRSPGFIEKTERIFTGTKVYSKSETFYFINPSLPASDFNCYVTASYAWADIWVNGSVHLTDYVTFNNDPTQFPHSDIDDVPVNQAPGGVPVFPDTRIDNTYKVIGSSSWWSYCRTTWELVNPQLVEYYFPFKYVVNDPLTGGTRNVYTGFKVLPFDSKRIVVRWEDLRVDWTALLTSTTIQPPATGPYYSSMIPAPASSAPSLPVGTSGSYYLPAIPTKHYIIDTYISSNFWRP